MSVAAIYDPKYPYSVAPVWQNPPQTSLPISVPIAHSDWVGVEAPYFGGNGATMALGPASQVSGRCWARHPGSGACWGSFLGDQARFVDRQDHDVTKIWTQNLLNGPVAKTNLPMATNTQFTSTKGMYSSQNPALTTATANGIAQSAAAQGGFLAPGVSYGCPSASAMYGTSAGGQTDGYMFNGASSFGNYSNCPNTKATSQFLQSGSVGGCGCG